jgi:DNA (cytosine-5)-methyltransferase 1
MGLEAAGWSVAFANDIDPVKHHQYDAHFGDAHDHFVITDVHDFKPASVPSVQLATASFPCTDLSIAGGRAGIRAGESSAFWGFMRVLEGMGARRPPLVMLENVVGFVTSHDGRDFTDAMLALNQRGYSADALTLDARWFVPQSRPRIFIVASTAPGTTAPDPQTSRTRPAALVRAIREAKGVRWNLSGHPEPPLRTTRSVADIVEVQLDEPRHWWPRNRAEYFFNQLSPRHLATAREMIKSDTWSYATAFRRVRAQPDGTKRSTAELRVDGLAGCLRTPKGGSGRQILFRAGKGRFDVRLLTPRECVRLMGADDFRVSGLLNEALFGFGDAVCVPAVTWLANHVLPRAQALSGERLKVGAVA